MRKIIRVKKSVHDIHKICSRRMFRRGNYSKRALSTFEIIGSFIVDLYYNHFYQEAKRIRIDGRVESITDGYKHAIKAYLNSFQNPESYRKTIIGIHKYYYTTTKFNTISFSDCVNEMVKHFVPEDFFESTTNQQRDGILRRVLLNAVKQFSSDVLCSNILDALIDNHSDIAIVRNMQDKMVEALMFEREKMFQKIFNVSHKPVGGENYPIVAKMKTEVIKLVKENHHLTKKYKKLKEKSLNLLDIIKKQCDEIESLKEPNDEILEQAEKYRELKKKEQMREQFDKYNPENNFDKYMESRNESIEENKTIVIPDTVQGHRPPKEIYSYMPHPPADNIILPVEKKYEWSNTTEGDGGGDYSVPSGIISTTAEVEPISLITPSNNDFFKSTDMLNIE